MAQVVGQWLTVGMASAKGADASKETCNQRQTSVPDAMMGVVGRVDVAKFITHRVVGPISVAVRVKVPRGVGQKVLAQLIVTMVVNTVVTVRGRIRVHLGIQHVRCVIELQRLEMCTGP